MDPYLQSRWDDVHPRLLVYLSEAIQERLPDDLRARVEQQLTIVGEDDERTVKPDVDVAEMRSHEATRVGGASAAVMEAPQTAIEPIRVLDADAPAVQRWVQIVDRTLGYDIVTVFEILSPWNKRRDQGSGDYARKIQRFRAAGVNVVELDLLRGTRAWLPVSEESLPADRRESYQACITHPDGGWNVYPMSLRNPLPPIPVPLRPRDADLWLELQPLLDRVYRAGRYDDIDYGKEPIPPLSGEDAQWADALLRDAGRRAAAT